LGQLDRAQQFLAEALSTTVDGTAAGRAAAVQSVVLAQLDRCDEALERYQQALAQEPANALALEARELCEGLPPTPLPSPSPVPTEPGVPALQGHIFYPLWNEGNKRYDLYMRRVDGSGRELIVTGANQPALQPGGEWLAANGERHLEENLLVLRPNGADLVEISEHIEDGLPAWSTDGKKLAFASTQHGDRQSRIYVMDGVPLDGRRVAGRALNTGADDARGTQPFWTDDGQIIYSGCDYSADPVRCGLLLMPAAEGSYQPVAVTTYAGDTAPAVYGKRVAFMSDRSGSWEVYSINLDGSGLAQLTNNRANDGLPTWSPDGQTIAFVSDEGGAWAVWAIDLEGANRRKLFDLEGQGLFVDWTQQQISWGP
jgi:Tol biopolymer transport system component